MVRFVTVAQPLEDVDGVRQIRFADLNRLEATLERGILLKVLAVLVQRGRADCLQFATSQQWLQDARRVDRAFCSTRTDKCVNLVDEDDDVAARADFFRDLLQALFEVTAVATTGDKRAKVERVKLLVLERLGNVARDDGLCESFNHGGLTNAGFADEHGIVLGSARQNLHDALDFFLAPDDRVELAFAGLLRQVTTELVENLRALTCGL